MGDDDMTLEEQIGIRVRENQEAHRRFVEEHRDEWIRQGRGYRRARETLRVTRREMKQMIGASESTIASFEAGNPVQRRPLIESSYITALRLIELQRRPVLDAVALGVIPSADDRSRNPFMRLRRSRQQD